MKKLVYSVVLSLLALAACVKPDAPKGIPAPSGLVIKELSENSVYIQWDYVEGASIYRWIMSTKGEIASGILSGNHMSSDRLKPGTEYLFKVCCEDELRYLVSDWTEITFTTPGSAEPEPEPEPEQPVTHTLKVIFIGDSITRLWPEKDAVFFSSHGYLGKGIDGQTSKTIAGRFKTDVVNNDPYVVHIMCGINDVAENDGYYVESSAILANIEKMADMAEEAKIKVVVGSLTPANKFWWWADSWKPSRTGVTIVSHILEANSLISEWCEERGYPFIDYYTPFVDADGGFPQPYAYDGVHPALTGFQEMDKLVQPVLDSLLRAAGAI